jgi:hypothetical protein
MFNIPGRPGQTCEGPTRRELMRIGSLGLAGLHLPGFFLSQQSAKAANLADKFKGARGFEHSRRIQADQNENPRHLDR